MSILFSSDRIDFVSVSETLIPDYLEMVNDYEHVGKPIGSKQKTYTAADEQKWVRTKLEEHAQVYSMLERGSGAFIGNIELMDPEDESAELGIAITARMQEQGYGTEGITRLIRYGFQELGFKRICLRVFPENLRAIHVYEKCGFREYDRTNDDVFMEIFAPTEV